MRNFTAIILFVFISTALYGSSSKVWVRVQATEDGDFKGFLWSDVDETVGEGASPAVTSEDVMSAIRGEFSDPQEALSQLERLRANGGELLMQFGYRSRSEANPEISGKLTYNCGVMKNFNPQQSTIYSEWDTGVVSDIAAYRQVKNYADTGKFYQFKWASRAQIRRFIARCFARLPGMPPLREHRPQDPSQLYIPSEIYTDLFQWMSTIPGVSHYSATHAKFRKAAKCLVSNAANYIPDRVGNAVVLQRQKNDKDEHSHRLANLSENFFLPGHLDFANTRGSNRYNYSIAFLDQHSLQNVRRHWEKDEIQTGGIWPNYQGASVASVLAQAYGDEFTVNVKACLLSSGIQVPNPNEALPTMYNPFSCREIDQTSVDPDEFYKIACANGNALSCYVVASSFEQGKSFTCLPKDVGGSCFLSEGLRDSQQAKDYFGKACDLGLAMGCKMRGRYIHNQDVNLLRGHDVLNSYYIRACELENFPECPFYRLGLKVVDESNKGEFEYNCNMFITHRETCTSLGVYYLAQNDKAKAQDFFERGCRGGIPSKLASSCVQLAKMYLAEGKRALAIEALKVDCSANRDAKYICRELYNLYEQDGNQEAMQQLVQSVCGSSGQICF